MRIGVLAAAAGATTKAIRFYEQSGLLPAPARTAAGYRDYPENAAVRIGFIHSAQAAGLTLAEIREILAIRDGGTAPCRHVSALIDRHLAEVEARLAELRRTRTLLRELAATAHTTDPATCAEGEVCRILAPAEPPSGAMGSGARRSLSSR
ncbi:MAG: heavy metal-responsive transcriptional regulator [Streptosporangiaceae bacterium]